MIKRECDFKNLYIKIRKMLTTHFLTHTFQHILFDWLKFTLDPPNINGTHMIW